MACGDTLRVVPLPSFTSARPLVIAHRGASGYLPEQTLEAFDRAIDQGADAIELDVVPTRDGVLVARHENELSVTTNIADHPEFASRPTTKNVDGGAVTGWFTEDFTAADLRKLRARQRFPFRSHSYDERFALPTLDDVLEWRLRRQKAVGRQIGVFIEVKHPTYFSSVGLNVREPLLRTLDGADSGVVVMSFEPGILRELRGRSDLPLIQLLDAPQSRPFDWMRAEDQRTFADLITPPGLAEIAKYADGIGPWKRLIVPALSVDTDGDPADNFHLGPPTSLIRDAHSAGLFVCSWTFRDEPAYLAADYAGKPSLEYEQFFSLGLDAAITDFPDTAVVARG
jgi:glycerophosphoryl diester phosphodiesterase